MIKESIQKALNEQINAELYSAYLYFAMSSFCEDQDMPGFANWMYNQALEESSHALRLYRYLVERDGRAVMKGIDEPPNEWKDAVDVFENVYAHEQKVTAMINKLVDLAIKESDHATNNMLQWFVNEQVEEEATAKGILQQLKMMKDAPGGMYMLDQKLAQRTFTPPADSAEE